MLDWFGVFAAVGVEKLSGVRSMGSRMLGRDALREMMANGQSLDVDIRLLLEQAFEDGYMPESLSLANALAPNLHDIYTVRQGLAPETGIEILGINTFLEKMSQSGGSRLDMFSVSVGDYTLVLVFNIAGTGLLAGIAVRKLV